VQEGEVLRLTASEVGLERLQEEMKEQAAASRDREHRQELLLTDKAYLSRQVEDLEARLRLREEEVEGLRSKVAELKAGRAELYQKLYDSTASRTTEVGEGCGEDGRHRQAWTREKRLNIYLHCRWRTAPSCTSRLHASAVRLPSACCVHHLQQQPPTACLPAPTGLMMVQLFGMEMLWRLLQFSTA
jgi:hypothetical protein